jgi:hypothetical protein
MILPYDANPGRMEFSERTGTAQPASRVSSVNCGRVLEMPAIPRVSRPIVFRFWAGLPIGVHSRSSFTTVATRTSPRPISSFVGRDSGNQSILKIGRQLSTGHDAALLSLVKRGARHGKAIRWEAGPFSGPFSYLPTHADLLTHHRPSAGLSNIGLAELAVVAEGAASDTVTCGLTYPFCCIHDA